jgi:hypothetical protein
MGNTVYDAGSSTEGLDIFVHSLKNSSNGYAALIINPKDAASSIQIPANAEQYLLTANGENLQTKTVKLNGEELALTAAEKLPQIKGKKIKAGEVQVPPHSILFLAFSKR